MDDALMVTNLVYFGTLIVGGALIVFLAAATVITLIIAGAGQGVASIVATILRLLRTRPHEEPEMLAEAARTEYTRKAVVAKADAILAARRADAAAASAATAASKAAAASPSQASGSEDAEPDDEEVAIPAAFAATKPAPARAIAVVSPMRTARPAPARSGPHTGTQPALVVGRAS
ncbi:hypothetical protein [Sinomonas sp. P10A9]|uniref:Uncharacterized protein n=1 Tax=Sinomonas puerhi TaxID=3238584 RepID=A0AB39L241_9MICC